MTNPASGGAAQAATEMMKEVQEAMKQAEQVAQQSKPTSVEFSQVLQSQQTTHTQHVQGVQHTTEVLRSALHNQHTIGVPAVGQVIDTHPLRAGFERIMHSVASGQNKLENIMNLCLSGRNFSSEELLALQAGVFRFTQELELTSKVVEKATSAVKQTLNTQV